MSDEQTTAAPDGALLPGAMTEDEYRKFCEKSDSEPPPPPTEDDHQRARDMNWAEQDPEVQRLYEGKWVAVHNQTVLSAGGDFTTVRDEALRVSGLSQRQVAIVAILDSDTFLNGHGDYSIDFSECDTGEEPPLPRCDSLDSLRRVA
jgi:hypothetical protein